MTAREAAQETARKIALYHATLDAAGHDEATLAFCREWSMVQKMIYVGESDEQADGGRGRAAQLPGRAVRRSPSAAPRRARASRTASSASPRSTAKDFLNKAMIVGGPETVAESIAEYQAAGVDHLTLVFIYGQLNPALAAASLRRFID